MRLVILDRDGVINEDSDEFIKSPEEWTALPGSLEAIARLCRAEFKVVVITNQSGIGRGLFDMDALNRIHSRMLDHIHRKGGEIDALFFCPHGPDDGCTCRKPLTGMFEDLAERLKINLAGIPTVGDSLRDIQVAQAVKALPILVRTGKGAKTLAQLEQDKNGPLKEISVYDDLAAFVDDLLRGVLDARIDTLSRGPADS